MRVSRESLLSSLHAVSPGLDDRESIQQSSCVVFTSDGRLMTFNGEICASLVSPLVEMTGAVKSKSLVTWLSKLNDDLIEVSQSDGLFHILTKSSKKAGVRMEAEVLLPVEKVDIPRDWLPLSADFMEGIGIVHSCASRDTQTDFSLTCLHITSEYVEATDRTQICRYMVKTDLPEETLVRSETMRKIVACGATEISVTPAWLHFRNPAGLILSVRRFGEAYRDLGEYLTLPESTDFVLPGGLSDVLSRAEIFSADNLPGENFVILDLKPGTLIVEGEGISGWCKEKVKVVYDGIPLRFRMSPKLLLSIIKRSMDCKVARGRLLIDGGNYRFITTLMAAVKK